MARPAVSSGRLKRRRRRLRIVIASGAGLLCLLVFGGVVWLSHAAFLRVVNIQVSGTETIPTSTIEAFARAQMQGNYGFLFAKDNIFLYPRAGIAAGLLERYPVLRSADVHAKDFNTVEVVVAERQPVALWCPQGQSEEGCSYLDESGLLYAPAPQFSTDPYLVYSGPTATTSQANLTQYLTPSEFQSLAALVAALEQKEPDDPIGQVAVDNNGDARAYFKDSFVLMFSLKDDGGDVFERFTLALSSDAFAGKSLGDFEYLDLRFGDRLFYKLKDASE